MSAYVIQPWYGVVEKLAKVSRMITEYIIGQGEPNDNRNIIGQGEPNDNRIYNWPR